MLGLYGMLGTLSCEILLLLNVPESDMVVCYVEGCEVSSAELRCSFSGCIESFLLYIVGKMAQDPDTGLSWKAFRG